MKVLNNLDFALNQLLNAVLHKLGSAPGSPAEGQVYYNSTTKASYTWDGTAWVPHDARKLSNGSLPLALLASDPLARANHTGTQAASTISDFDNAVRTNRLDQMAAPTAAVAMGGQRLTGLGAPTAGTDAATRQYVDDTVAGLSWKEEVDAATTGNITLSGAQTIDGFAVTAGMRVLVKDQTTGSANGIYTVAAGAWSRASDADTAAELTGTAVFVKNGATNAGQRFVCSTTGTITLGTTSISFAVFGGGSSYVAGNGLALNTNSFSVVAKAGGGLTVDGSGVAVDGTVARKFSANVGDGAATTVTVTHNLNTKDVTVNVREVAGDAFVMCDIVAATVNTVTLSFAAAPAAASLRATVIG